MKKSFFVYFLSVLAVMLLSFGAATIVAQQTQQPDPSDTSTANAKSNSKSKSKTKASAVDSSQAPAGDSNAAAPASTSAPVSKPAPAPKPSPGAGTVWVNTDSGIYHKPGTKWYGKTKQGKYMTEADAKKAGYRPAEKE
jgi:cytoskeletal protein RodZ